MIGKLAALILLAILAHALSLSGGFVYDDHRFVEQNPALGEVTLGDAVLDASTHTSDRDRDVYRPLRLISHAWDARHWGLDPFGFHVHSLVLHVLNVILAFFVLRHLLAPEGTTPAILGAGLLAVHPLGVEVVGWISSRGDLYALGFGLLALGLATGWWKSRAALVGAALAAFLATMAKESAAILPVVAWLHGVLLRRTPRDTGHFRNLRAGPWVMLVGVGACFVLRQIAVSGASPVQTAPHGGDLLSQAGWALFGLSRTLGALVFPTGLSVEYPQDTWALDPLPIWLRPTTLLGLLAIVTPFAFARRGHPRAAFLSAWVLLAYLPSSSLLVTLRELVNDRAAYPMLPAAGALLGLACRGRRPLAWCLLLCLGLPLALASSARSTVFRNDKTLWTDVLVHHQDSVRAHLGLAELATEEPSQRFHLTRAAENSRPGSKLQAIAMSRLGEHLLLQTNDPPQAIPVLEQAWAASKHWEGRDRTAPKSRALAAALAQALEEVGRSNEAEVVLSTAISEAPEPTMLLVKRVQIRLVRALRSGDASDVTDLMESIEDAERRAPNHPLVQPLRELARQRLGESALER
ncbi:MAG: tetratricopeptide repeat protein [Planctomycetota bacterium]|nr:tetratricopeptide repeat protein [Planctomycetota bacterium]